MAPKAAAPHFGPTGYYEIAPASFRTGTFLKAVDTNGDSFTDLVVVTAGSTKISVLFGDGHGKFKNRLDSDIDGIVYSGGNVAEGDFNSDGHPDLVIAMNKGPLRLMIGDGKGGFAGTSGFERVGPNRKPVSRRHRHLSRGRQWRLCTCAYNSCTRPEPLCGPKHGRGGFQ
jgi:hypothetical protein